MANISKIQPFGSSTQYDIQAKYDGNGNEITTTYFIKSSYTIPIGKGVRITYPTYAPVLISCQRSNSGARLILLGGGYGAGGTVRNDFTEVVSCSTDTFAWSIPQSDDISNSIEITNSNTGGNATVICYSTAACTFTAIDTLTSIATNRTLLHSSNYTDYTVTKTGNGATGTWPISINGNASSASHLNITSTDNAIARFDGTNGTIQNSGVIIDDNNNINTTGNIIISKQSSLGWDDSALPSFQMVGADNKVFKFKYSVSGTNIDIGWDYTNGDGPGAAFRNSNSSNNPGAFIFYARKNTSGVKNFIGLPDGTLTWDGRRVVTSTNSTAVGSSTLPVYIDANGYAQTITSYNGNAATATAFSSNATVTLTGDTTGTSAGSTKSWSIATNTYKITGIAETDTALTTSPGAGKIRYSYNVSNPTGIFPRNDNSNSILTLSRHQGGYDSQLGFSSNGNIYYRAFGSNTALNNTLSWKQLAFIDSTVTSANSLATPHKINGTDFDGTTDITTVNWGSARNITIGDTTKSVDGSQNLTWSKAEIIGGGSNTSLFLRGDHTWTRMLSQDHRITLATLNSTPGDDNTWLNKYNFKLQSLNNAMAFFVGGGENERKALIQVGHAESTRYANIYGELYLNKFGGQVYINSNYAAKVTSATDGQVMVADGTTGGIKTTGYTIAKSIPSNAIFTDTTYTLTTGDGNGQIKITPSSGSAYNINVKGLGSAAFTDSSKYFIKSTYTLPVNKGVRIKYPSHAPVLISCQTTLGGSRLILIGGGYGENGTVRNDFTELVSCSGSFEWSLPQTNDISTSLEIINKSQLAYVVCYSTAECTFSEINSLYTPAQNRTLLHSSNFNNYTPKLDGTGAYGTWGINADKVDGYHFSAQRYTWSKDYSQPTANEIWYMKISTAIWNNTPEVIQISCAGSNRQGYIVLYTGSRQERWFGYATFYNFIGLLGVKKIITQSDDIYLKFDSTCTNVTIKTSFTPTITTENASTTDYTPVSSGLFGNAAAFTALSGISDGELAITTTPGTGAIKYSYGINANVTGLFSNSDNSNSIITLNRHPGNYDSQFGLSSNGKIYYRFFTDTALNTTSSWKQIAFTDSNVASATKISSTPNNTTTFLRGDNTWTNVLTGQITATKFIGPLQGNASTATTLETSRTFTIGNTSKSFNGSSNISWSKAEIIGGGSDGSVFLRGDHTWARKLNYGHGIASTSINNTNNDDNNWNNKYNFALASSNNIMTFFIGGTVNNRVGIINVGHADTTNYSNVTDGQLYLNKFGGQVYINSNYAAKVTSATDGQVMVADGTTGGIKTNGFLTTNLIKRTTYSLPYGKGVRITYPTYKPILISANRSNGGGQLILLGSGYGANGTVRNTWTEVVSCSTGCFTWSLPQTDDITNSIDIMHNQTSGSADIEVWCYGDPTFTEINALYTPAQNRILLHSSNYTDYTVTKTGSGASGTWGINITGSSASCTGNAASAAKLQTARTINGTSFDGSANITTTNWGTARNISISDADSSNTGSAVSINGSAAATLKLPATIKATLKGNADTATNADKVDNQHVANGTFLYRGYADVTINGSGLHYIKIDTGQTYYGPLMRFYIVNNYSNIQGATEIDVYSRTKKFYARTTSYNGNNIRGWCQPTDNNNIYYLSVIGPESGNGTVTIYCSASTITAVEDSSLSTATYTAINSGAITTTVTIYGSLSGNAATATKATQDGSGNEITSTYIKKSGDTMTGQLNCNNHLMVYTATSGNAYNNSGSAIQVREVGGVGSAQSAWEYAPKIGFHWSGRVACQLGLDSSQYLTLYSNNSTNGGYFRAGELFTTNSNGLRLAGGSGTTKSILLRNDGSNFWILCCNSVNAGDNWITPTCGGHPFHINLESGICYATKLYGAVWNDYAEYRKDNPEEKEVQQPGRCVREVGDGTLALTTERLERGCEIISDTFGFAIGQDEENGYNTPIASNGRVLAYPYESIEEFSAHIGWPVCSGPDGTVSIMTEEEEEKYPSRIIGTISEIPTYEIWGTGNVQVNGRIWIRIK